MGLVAAICCESVVVETCMASCCDSVDVALCRECLVVRLIAATCCETVGDGPCAAAFCESVGVVLDDCMCCDPVVWWDCVCGPTCI